MKLLVIDGNSILNRSFYAIKRLQTSDGRNTNGIFGFMKTFYGLIDKYAPDAVAVAFDVHAPTFRHKMFEAYKGTRHPSPVELIEQFAPLKELLVSLGYCVVEKEGYEADDILGTLSHACGEDDVCFLATGDRDSLQLVRKNVFVVLSSSKAGQSMQIVYDESKIREDYLVSPEQLIDIKAIQGDTSDNIPGVAGIGEKGAKELISKFGSLDNIYENLDTLDINPKMKIKLEASKENAYLSRTLGTICLDAPISTDLGDYIVKAPDVERASSLIRSLEMYKLLERIDFIDKKTESELPSESVTFYEVGYEEIEKEITSEGAAYFVAEYDGQGIASVLFKTNRGVALVKNEDFMFSPFISQILENEKIEKFTDNSKKLFSFCDVSAVKVKNIKLDTSLAGYLLDPNSGKYSLQDLAKAFSINVKIETEGTEGFYSANTALVDSAAVLRSVSAKLLSKLTANCQYDLLENIEIPLARVLASMEREGFSIDKDALSEYSEKVSLETAKKLVEIYRLAGYEFNVNSPKQLGEVLFDADKLALPHGKKTKSGYSTDAETLEGLKDKHPVIPAIIEYRLLAKLKSTYCDGLLKVIDNDGRIHSTLNQTETRTGRISSAEPNLQNIPVRTPMGRELRKFFNARPGYVLVDADYSQIELRVLAALSDDEKMISSFIDGTDIHAMTASRVFGVSEEDITPELRRKAKAVNFGIVYGMGSFSLSKDINVSVKEADMYINNYFATYSGVSKYLENAKRMAKERGYAETLFGRRRYLPELQSQNNNIRKFGERVAMNMPIQGTAADIIKIAMIKVAKRLSEEEPSAHLIMQIHDELIIEAPEDKAEKVSRILRDEMENACEMKVPLTVDAEYGRTWYDTK